MRGVDVDLDARRDAGALASWQARMAPIWDIQVTTAGARTFRVAGTTWQFPSAFLNRSAGSAQLMVRTPALIKASRLDHVQLFRLDKGRVASDYDGQDVSLRAGDLVFLDYGRPMTSRAGAFASSSLLLARHAAPARFRDGVLHGTVLEASTPAALLLGRHLDAA